MGYSSKCHLQFCRNNKLQWKSSSFIYNLKLSKMTDLLYLFPYHPLFQWKVIKTTISRRKIQIEGS